MGKRGTELSSEDKSQGRQFWDDLDQHLGENAAASYWTGHPRVRAHINQCVSGSPQTWPLEWLKNRLAGRWPLSRALVVGCGTGGLERDLIHKEMAQEVVGVDIASEPLRFAREEAEREGMGDRIHYIQADARTYLRDQGTDLPAIFFHASLHHFDGLDGFMKLLATSLEPGGLLYLDEYVGPSMHQWNARRLLLPNLAYYLLPWGMRRPWLVRTPANPQDPTEAVCAADIFPCLARHFQVLEQKDYGGNLLSLIYPNLARPGSGKATEEKLNRTVKRLIFLERLLLGAGSLAGLPPFYTVILAEPKK